MNDRSESNRRTVLKTLGAGVVGSVAVTGGASAGGDYGNGNGIGAFLNEEAEFKNQPIWDSGVADETGKGAVDVVVGSLTSIDVPNPDAPDKGPFGFAPMAVKVSPGTTVKWTWATGHHTVTSLEDGLFDIGHHKEQGDTFTHTFNEVGNYLYFCHPHGTPYPIETPIGELENLFGMRGAVKVSDD